jgi:hypothetical protein
MPHVARSMRVLGIGTVGAEEAHSAPVVFTGVSFVCALWLWRIRLFSSSSSASVLLFCNFGRNKETKTTPLWRSR